MTKQERLEKMKQRFQEMTHREKELRTQGIRFIAGMDEVGRGPLAGPVYAACVVLPEDFSVLGVDDSKKLSEKKRLQLDEEIRQQALAVGIGVSTPAEIDDINILEATKRAMTRSFCQANQQLSERFLGTQIEYLLIDALELEEVDVPQEGIIHGDANAISIAAASILAKVARDAYMVEMDQQYPGYAFAQNKGYGTRAHYDGIRAQGVTPIHRRSFLKNFQEKHGRESNREEATLKEVSVGKNKFYAVRQGRETGIFADWADCKKQVEGFSGAEYKSFSTRQEAEAYLGITEGEAEIPNDDVARIYVDGSYNSKTKQYGCGVVVLYRGEVRRFHEAYDDLESASLRNVAGEVMGAVRAIQYCRKYGIRKVEIYHDYNGIGKWGNDEWKANLPLTRNYKQFVANARSEMEITFIKVAAHTGNRYNEEADRLAKDAIGLL